ncbi:DUF1491 family protein [Litorimonas sp. RW-G-Af-16]|uniref:DUF1491 family protein n=1 Tax=Litorimonas sp. RW-G-Af-16 TaxID=3241168 RepID=UPI00390C9945
MSPRLKTQIAVSGLLRTAQSAGAFAAILRKGDPDSGAYLVSVRAGHDVTLYTAERNMDGDVVWIAQGPMTETDATAKINRRVDFDPDLWVVEIEDPQGRSFLDGVVSAESAQPSAEQAAAEALFRGPKPRR